MARLEPIKIQLELDPDRLLYWTPTREGGDVAAPAYLGDVGVDLSTTEDIEVPPGEIVYAPLGVAFAPPADCWLMLTGRSSTAAKLGLATIPGIIDSGYRGEMFAGVYKAGGRGESPDWSPIVVPAGTTIAQAILIPAIFPRLVEVDELPPSDRGTNGFGSSGAVRGTPRKATGGQPGAVRVLSGPEDADGPGEATETPPGASRPPTLPRWCSVHQEKEELHRLADGSWVRRGRCGVGSPDQCLLEEVS